MDELGIVHGVAEDPDEPTDSILPALQASPGLYRPDADQILPPLPTQTTEHSLYVTHSGAWDVPESGAHVYADVH
tara:strand:+ start:1875 stop:2099 length:225 start_codon:yes stop_codon:yes gene_type:complete